VLQEADDLRDLCAVLEEFGEDAMRAAQHTSQLLVAPRGSTQPKTKRATSLTVLTTSAFVVEGKGSEAKEQHHLTYPDWLSAPFGPPDANAMLSCLLAFSWNLDS
jgi:hypothetical protein